MGRLLRTGSGIARVRARVARVVHRRPINRVVARDREVRQLRVGAVVEAMRCKIIQ